MRGNALEKIGNKGLWSFSTSKGYLINLSNHLQQNEKLNKKSLSFLRAVELLSWSCGT